MRGELVALDIETTGFYPEMGDTIIEIGIVRMVDGKIVQEEGKLINPERTIPDAVTNLTGIRSEDVAGKPIINAVLPWVRTFVGNAPIVGHNVGFDLGFLGRYGVLQNNLRIDTYDLASILLPRAPRYTLSGLASGLDVKFDAHRAVDDARASAILYWDLWQKTLALPLDILRELLDLSSGLSWDTRHVLEAAFTENSRNAPSADSRQHQIMFGPAITDEKALQPKSVDRQPLDVKTTTAMVEENGALAQHFPNYEHRAEQAEMTRLVTEAFNQSHHTIIEAGTGTGKSIAYLVPSILWSITNQERVVISTNTINLQEQLIGKDIPMLTEALGLSVKAALLKGRGNYLCPRRLTAVRRRRPTSLDEFRTLAKVLVWLLESSSGDRGEITLRGPVENNTWQRLSAEDENCTLNRCQSAMQGTCPFYKARKAAEAANLVIVNHALLLSDATTDNRVLPDYQYAVIDEAHHLEEATTSGLSFRLDEAALVRRLADLGGLKRGLLGDLLHNMRAAAPEREIKRLEAFIGVVSSATTTMEAHIKVFFDSLRDFYTDILGHDRSNDHAAQVRITHQLRDKSAFAQVGAAWGTLAEFMQVISEKLAQLTEYLGKLSAYNIPNYDDLLNSTGATARFFAEVEKQLSNFVHKPDENTIYWLNGGQNLAYLSLHTAPLHIGPMVSQYLWQNRHAVVLTSATLQSNGSFDYLQNRLGAETVATHDLGSPFNYAESTLIFVPDDMPEPNERHQYQQALERGIVELAAALEGRILVLFTSYTQLRQTAQAITPRLALGDIAVYDQSDGSSRQALLDGFKSASKAVLLGTRSFWEGVDIPGEALSALIITRLPFAVPTEPIFAARSETYKDSFNEYALPDAILRFRQGFGRLIRTRTDRGIIAIFDKRIISKAYGKSFLEALPDCTVQYDKIKNLPTIAQQWLNHH